MRSKPVPRRAPWPPEATRLAAVLLLVITCAPAIIRGLSFDSHFQASCSSQDSDSGGGSGLGSGDEQDWWLENITNGTNFTELCSGVMDPNSSEFIYSNPEESTFGNYSFSPCNDFYIYDRCDIHDFITLTTDPISYVNAHSTIVVTVEPNATDTDDGKLYYKLCYNTFGEPTDAEVIECVSNGTMMVSEYRWKKSGEAILTVHVFTSPSFNDSDFLDCGIAHVTVANNSGLNLTVRLLKEPLPLDEGTEAYGEEEGVAVVESVERGGDEEEQPHFITGNITFVTTAKLTANASSAKPTYYYTFKVKGPSWEDAVCSLQPNWTRDCQEVGVYNYSIHAIAKLNRIVAYHAHIAGEFTILEGVSNTQMLVGTNNSVRVGSQEQVTITAEGSTPIIVCWFETKAPMQDPMNITTPEPTLLSPPTAPTSPPPSPIKESDGATTTTTTTTTEPVLQNCIFLNDSNSTVYRENRTFNTVGEFQYVAHFYNGASRVQRNFTYHVEPGQSPAVVASSATAIVVLAVLVALVIVTVALIAGGYIPYRKYKNRMTETADFRFVDLSENGKPWDRFKLKANQFMDYFRQRRHNEKIGLVNLGSVPMLEERRLFYGTNTLTQFAPYETM